MPDLTWSKKSISSSVAYSFTQLKRNPVDDDDDCFLQTYLHRYTKHGEDVEVCKLVAEADLMVYVNVNYVSMDGGYKSYATGMLIEKARPDHSLSLSLSLSHTHTHARTHASIHIYIFFWGGGNSRGRAGLVTYNSLKHNHDSKTLTETKSLYDPQRSAMHKSFNRIGKIIQKEVDIFHVETVIDENLFPWFLNWIVVLKRNMSVFQKTLMWSTVLSLKLVPLFLRKWILWAVRGQQGLLQIRAGKPFPAIGLVVYPWLENAFNSLFRPLPPRI